MKISVTFKSPDAVFEALREIENEDTKQKMDDFISEYVEYGEYITVEFDTVKKTATVLKK